MSSGNVVSNRENAEKAFNAISWGSCLIRLSRFKEMVKPFKFDSQKKKTLGKRLKFHL